MSRFLPLALILAALPALAPAASVYRSPIDDPKAVYLTSKDFAVRADGLADDSDAIQAAIDRLQESNGQGIVFIPQGRYRLTRTVYIWPGIRVIGYGATRPVFVLADSTPGFQKGVGTMVFFAGMRPSSQRPFPPAAPAARHRAAQPRHRRRQPRHLLLRHEQHRF